MFPVAVIGGGPAGSICALQLARQGVRVALFDRRGHQAARPAETCSPRVRMMIEAACGQPIPDRLGAPLDCFWSAWGSSEFVASPFHFWHAGRAIAVTRPAFDAWLIALAERAGVEVFHEHEVKSGHFDGKAWYLSVHGRERARHCRACFVVEATGRASRSPVQPGAGRHFIDRLICLSADLPKRAGAEAVAGIESCPDGWWYTAENTVGRTVSLFANADALTGLDDRAQYFADALKRTIHIGQLVDLPAPAPRPTTICARTSIRRMIWKRNWAASGDAAQTIDPLSGGGIGRAVEDALELAPAVSHALSGRGDDPLRSYALGRVQRFQEELAIRYNYYDAERRWSPRPFWRQRIADGAPQNRRARTTNESRSTHVGTHKLVLQ